MNEINKTFPNLKESQLEAIYKEGWLRGLECFAWWKDGTEYVGTSNTTLKYAKENVSQLWNYQYGFMEALKKLEL